MCRHSSRVVIVVILTIFGAACGEAEPRASDVRPNPTVTPIDGLDAASPTAQATPASDPSIALPPGLAVPQGVTLRRSDGPPLISQQQAMQAVVDFGVPWGLGGTWQGKPVTVIAYYGLATFGSRAADGQWIGVRNLHLPTGEILDHIEERPMWLLDYGNTVFYGGGCPDCPPSVFNHSVYTIDAATGAVLLVWGYSDGAESAATPSVEPSATPNLTVEERKATEQAGLPTAPPPATPAPGDPFRLVVVADYTPTPPTARELVLGHDAIVIGTVVEILPAQWTTPDGRRPANPHQSHFTIITPAVLELDEAPLVNHLDADFSSGRVVVATEGGQVGDDVVEFERPLVVGLRVLVGLSAIYSSQPDGEQPVLTPAGPAWWAGTRYGLTEHGIAVSRWGTQPTTELIEALRAAAAEVPTPSP